MISKSFLPSSITSRLSLGVAVTCIAKCVVLVFALLELASVDITHAADARAKPNVVFILADDLGWADIGCYGSRYYETPHIDRLATQGMRFTDAYAACAVCSPTRASILTGKCPARLHLTDYIPGEYYQTHKIKPLRIPSWQPFLALEEVTIAEALKSAGYVSASIGKWHLGEPPYYPEHQGFDINVGGSRIGMVGTYFWPYEKAKKNPLATPSGLKEGSRTDEYLTDRLTSEAERFIEQYADKPFFLYLSHYAVHIPVEAKSDTIAKYKKKPPHHGQKNPVYAAMIESVDDSVGRVLAKLDATGIADRTVVIFTSDNGGYWPLSTSNEPLRAGKGYPYEGGAREPLIIRWPGVVTPASTCGEPVSSIDFYPTILRMAGAKGDPRHNCAVDGVSIIPLLAQTGTFHRDALYWHYPHYWHKVRPFGAVRAGDWKLIEFYEDGRVELYNLKNDIGEKNDLAGQSPDKATELRRMLADWRKSVDAQMPTPNPEYHGSSGPGQEVAPARTRDDHLVETDLQDAEGGPRCGEER